MATRRRSPLAFPAARVAAISAKEVGRSRGGLAKEERVGLKERGDGSDGRFGGMAGRSNQLPFDVF
eukprot:9074621-Pyramimonas_sp.AAC.1